MREYLRALYSRLTAGESTEQLAIQSGIWAAGINVGDRVLQLLKVVILARLLSPEAFGLLGIALLAIGALQKFSELGFDEALVQHEDENVDDYLNTAWVIKIIRGVAIAVVAFLTAPYLAVFFGEAQAEPLIRVIGFSPLILGLQNPAVMYFQKNLNFHKEFVYQVGGRVVDLVVAVVIALVFRSVWALVAGVVAMNVVKFVVSYFIHEYRPNIEFNLSHGKEMFGFGKWMFASAILIFLYGQGDDAFVGWFFAASSLGVYQLAYRFSNAPATEVTQVISRVAFPALSKVQNDTAQLREGYFRVLHMTTIVGFPMAAGVIAITPQFILAVLGEQWAAAIPVMQALAVWGGIRSFGASTGALFKAVGRPDIGTKIQALKVMILAVVIYPAATEFGVLGVAAAVIGNAVVVQPLVIYMILDVTDASLSRLVFLLACPLAGSVGMGLAVIGLDRMVVPGTGILQLSALVIAGVVIYVGVMLGIENVSRYKFSSLVSTFRGAV